MADTSILKNLTGLEKRTSGIQRAQTTWDHRPSTVLLKAPSLFGQKMHSISPYGLSEHLRHSQIPSGINGTKRF